MFIGVDSLNGHDFLGEYPGALCGDGPVVGRHGEFVLLRPGDPVLAAKVLRGLEHSARHRVVPAPGRHPAASQAVVHAHSARAGAPAHIGGIEGRVAHTLGATGDHQIVITGRHRHGGLNHRLQAGAATPVDLHAADGHRQSGIECDNPPQGGRLRVGVAVTQNDVIDGIGRKASALQQSGQRGDGEIDHTHRLEHAAVAADRSADRFTDHRARHLSHSSSSLRSASSRLGEPSNVPTAGDFQDGAGHVRRQV